MADPIYIVSGFPRSGTSMMMRAIEAGGIPCVYSDHGDANRNRNTLIPGYAPNPNGFYEDAPLDGDWSCFRGRAIKVFPESYDLIPPGEVLRVVYMRRDPMEIRRSYYGILSGPHDESVYSFLDNYDAKVADHVGQLRSIQADVMILDYARVVADPIANLSSLGWPIDIERSAAMIDPTLYRHRGAA